MKMKNNRGVGLMEAIIYVAILAVVSTLAVNSLLMMMKSFSHARLMRDINSSAEVAMERITRDARLAYDIDADGSVLGSNPGRLLLNTLDSGGSPTTMDFYLDNGALMVAEDGGAGQPLSAPLAEVTSLVFYKIETPISKAVKIEMELKATNTRYERTAKFYDTVILRGSY